MQGFWFLGKGFGFWGRVFQRKNWFKGFLVQGFQNAITCPDLQPTGTAAAATARPRYGTTTQYSHEIVVSSIRYESISKKVHNCALLNKMPGAALLRSTGNMLGAKRSRAGIS